MYLLSFIIPIAKVYKGIRSDYDNLILKQLLLPGVAELELYSDLGPAPQRCCRGYVVMSKAPVCNFLNQSVLFPG